MSVKKSLTDLAAPLASEQRVRGGWGHQSPERMRSMSCLFGRLVATVTSFPLAASFQPPYSDDALPRKSLTITGEGAVEMAATMASSSSPIALNSPSSPSPSSERETSWQPTSSLPHFAALLPSITSATNTPRTDSWFSSSTSPIGFSNSRSKNCLSNLRFVSVPLGEVAALSLTGLLSSAGFPGSACVAMNFFKAAAFNAAF
mmetsp:Transcript_7545/g.15145  ORF Transcript_7545/g.15145 Transcript_7545/m.15145 type:complete len:203 (-) Transcript_7545:310-918(-)